MKTPLSNLARPLLSVMLLSVAAASFAAPVGYSVNSDSSNIANEDSLYEINLETGDVTLVAPLSPVKLDVEGLAFDPDGTLYAIDDQIPTLFTLNPANAQVGNEALITGLPSTGDNDFGMTFGCDGTLYVTSVTQRALYRMNLSGVATLIGSLGVNISAIAAYGVPTQLYGLGNGLDRDGQTDAPNLYSIDTATGAASLIGPLGSAADPYTEAGLDFDQGGLLWAVTDRRLPDDLPSQSMQVDPQTGTASGKKILQEIGFESLAIAPPAGCDLTVTPPDDVITPPDDVPPPSGTVRGVPGLNPIGLAIASLLLLITGLLAARRL